MSLPRPSDSRPLPTASPMMWRRGMASGSKIVASKRFGGSAGKKTHHEKKDASERESPTESRFRGEVGGKFRALDGEVQSDETFDREIVDRMGPEFYEAVFQPSIREAVATGRKYEQFRDTIRKDWKPVRR
jgi:hypothetical protein